jgi:uncharacterized protein YbjQ (UPF0145 family)
MDDDRITAALGCPVVGVMVSEASSRLACQHAGMEQNAIRVQCPKCLVISTVSRPDATQWDCPCGLSYNLRRCSACGVVSHVTSMQQQHEPWNCTWCRAPNRGYTRRNDPATATVADLAIDMASHGLEFAGPRQAEQVRDTQPVLIVTTNDIPGYGITQVHGDVFGLIVRARNYFSNLGAQFRTLAGGEVAGYTKLLTDSRNQARERLWREARMRGANAVVGMRFDCNEIGGIMSEITAYGTAVTVEPVAAVTPAMIPEPYVSRGRHA